MLKDKKRKLFLIFIVFALLVSLGVVYLNRVILPTKAKAFVIKAIQDYTGKKVTLDSLNIHIFKGLVLRGLVIYEDQKPVVSVKEASCIFLVLPIIKKNIIIPSIEFKSPVIFLRRGPDNKFNIMELLANYRAQEPDKKAHPGFNIVINRVSILNGLVNFEDETVQPFLRKSIANINLHLYLSLPADIKFKLSCSLAAAKPIIMDAAGHINLPTQKLSAKINIKNLSSAEFKGYYSDFKVDLFSKNADILVEAGFKNSVLSSTLNFDLNDIPLSAKITVHDFKNPLVNIDISALELALLERFIRNSLKVNIPIELNGKGDLFVSILKKDALEIGGYFDIRDTVVRIDKINALMSAVAGRLEFQNNSVKWKDLKFQYLGAPYQSSGTVTDFANPRLELGVFSQELTLDSVITVNAKEIVLSKLEGKYLNSSLSVTGNIDVTDYAQPQAKLSGGAALNLEDLKVFFKQQAKQLEQVNPAGILSAKFDFNGNINDFESSAFEAVISSEALSAYGLFSQDFLFNLKQENGILNIANLHLSLYDGALDLQGAMNMNTQNLPYWVNFNLAGLKIEKLKLDTPLKDKDLAGTIQAQGKISGFSDDLSKLSGAGKILIGNGKLWELNLFQGLGKIIFTKEFEKIIFKEGSCGFIVRDSVISTDSLILKSDIVALMGVVKIGFDDSVDASINIQPLGTGLPLNDDAKNIVQALLGDTVSLGTIKINGTLKEPKYKFYPPVTNIIEGLKNSIFGSILGK